MELTENLQLVFAITAIVSLLVMVTIAFLFATLHFIANNKALQKDHVLKFVAFKEEYHANYLSAAEQGAKMNYLSDEELYKQFQLKKSQAFDTYNISCKRVKFSERFLSFSN